MAEHPTTHQKHNNPLNKEEIPEWHHQQELILKRWSEIGSSYRYLHDKSFKKFNTQNMWFALPVIVISTITGTANFAQGSFPPSWSAYVPLGIGFLNLSAGLITTVGQFLRVSELLEGHRAASLAYSKFARNISVELSLPVKERTDDGSIFITNCRFELDRLIEQSPDIPEDIISSFIKRFPEPTNDASGNPTNEYDFFRPEILDIRPIKIYRDNEADIKRKLDLAKKEALEESEKQAKRLENALKMREHERAKIIQETRLEFEKARSKQNNEVNKIIELTTQKTQAQLIKNKFSVSNIEETMTDLLGTLNQAGNIVDDFTDSDDSSHETPPPSPKNNNSRVPLRGGDTVTHSSFLNDPKNRDFIRNNTWTMDSFSQLPTRKEQEVEEEVVEEEVVEDEVVEEDTASIEIIITDLSGN